MVAENTHVLMKLGDGGGNGGSISSNPLTITQFKDVLEKGVRTRRMIRMISMRT